jgi:hypothetical protein
MKSAQPLSDAPAAIYVINHEDIVRSGATTIPEILRLAPNLEVYQTSFSDAAAPAAAEGIDLLVNPCTLEALEYAQERDDRAGQRRLTTADYQSRSSRSRAVSMISGI